MGHSLSTGEMPAHTHSIYYSANTANNSTAQISHGDSEYGQGVKATTSTGGGGSHTHGFTQPTISIPTSNAVPIDINVKFVDVIIATKD